MTSGAALRAAADGMRTAASAPVPATGKASPPASEHPQPQIDVDRARDALEQFVRSMRRELEFRVDEDTGRTIITVRNKETGEVVRQIPSEEVIALARSLADGRAALVDSEA